MILDFNIEKKTYSIIPEPQDNPSLINQLQEFIDDKTHSFQVKLLVLDNIKQQYDSGVDNIEFLNDIYMVGGAVRDILMNIEPKDKDYVLVNYNEEKLLSLGFKKVASDFPIFLDDNGYEFALARTEKKLGKSDNAYLDFKCETKNVTIHDDLNRRDFTINSIASFVKINMKSALEDCQDGEGEQDYLAFNYRTSSFDMTGDLISPLDDIKNKVLVHNDYSAFQEDPVRILRGCRFAARYGFSIADETKSLMTSMIKRGALNNITPERIFLEISKGLSEDNAQVMFEKMREIGALKVVLPELDDLFGIPQNATYHPEIDTGVHTMMVLKKACEMNLSVPARFASLLHDLGKAVTPKDILPAHHNHEKNGIPLVANVCNRLKVPNEYRTLALNVCEFHLNVHNAQSLNEKTIMKMFSLFKNENQFNDFVMCCKADKQGRLGLESKSYPQAEHLLTLYKQFQQNPEMKKEIAEKATFLKELGKDGEVIKNNVHSIKMKYLKQLNHSIKENLYSVSKNGIKMK